MVIELEQMIGKTVEGVEYGIYPNEERSYRWHEIWFTDGSAMYFKADDDIQPYDPFTTINWSVGTPDTIGPPL